MFESNREASNWKDLKASNISWEKYHMKPTDSVMCSGSRQMIALQSWSIKSRRKSTASSGYGGYCVIIKPFSFACVLKKWMLFLKANKIKNHIAHKTV